MGQIQDAYSRPLSGKKASNEKKSSSRSCGLEAGCYAIFSLSLSLSLSLFTIITICYYLLPIQQLVSPISSFAFLHPFLSSRDEPGQAIFVYTNCASVLFFFSLSLLLLFLFDKRNQRSRYDNARSHHTYNSVKLQQPMSNTSTPWVMLLMETVALFESSSKHLINTRKNQTYCPSQLLTKAVLESI